MGGVGWKEPGLAEDTPDDCPCEDAEAPPTIDPPLALEYTSEKLARS